MSILSAVFAFAMTFVVMMVILRQNASTWEQLLTRQEAQMVRIMLWVYQLQIPLQKDVIAPLELEHLAIVQYIINAWENLLKIA